MQIEKLVGSIKNYIWGGNKLKTLGKISEDKIAESWELSFHKDGLTKLENGKSLKESVSNAEIGNRIDKFKDFPLMIKLIDANDNLSVQVHPNDDYALANENSFGKTELWYIMDAEADACLYIGFNKKISKDILENAIKDKTVMQYLNRIPVKTGDYFFIKAGTIHAIGKGCLVCEIQQNSNITYRVYDYDRKGADGKSRELHLVKALEVINYNKYKLSKKKKCKYFKLNIEYINNKTTFNATKKSFNAIVVVGGNGNIDNKVCCYGDTFFVPANFGKYTINGNLKVLKIEI